MSRGSACSTRSGNTPWNACGKAANWQDAHRPACRLFRGPGQAGRHRAARRRTAGLAQPAGDTPRQPQRRPVLADRARSAGDGAGPGLGHLAVLVAPRPRRGAGPARGPDPGPQRRPATPAARPGPERSRLRPLRRRGPGPGPAAVQTEPPAVHASRGPARPGPDRGVPGSPAGRVRTRRGLRQRPARTDPRPAAGDGGPAADRAGARTVPAGCRADHQFPRPDPAQPPRSPPRRGAVHRRPECRAQRGRPVHRPDLAVRPGPRPPGRRRPGRRRRSAQAGPVTRGRAGDQPGLAYYLEALATVAASQDHPERAISLLAAAAALLEANGSGWLHAYVPRAPHDDGALARVRARTTEPAFERAQAYGRTITSTSMLRYALDQEELP